jgi:hypothetical protein
MSRPPHLQIVACAGLFTAVVATTAAAAAAAATANTDDVTGGVTDGAGPPPGTTTTTSINYHPTAATNNAGADDTWKMLNQYPAHYVAKKLDPTETITIDGKLDDAAWKDAEWTYDMVDITRHENQQLNAIPNDLQARVKIRWDSDYFYVGAALHESYITAKNVGHNNHAPYSPDNDFEIFIDVSGTTQYYVEFEMSVQNATYDIKWGKPDGTPLQCDNSGMSWPALPTCVNTSFRGYAGNWTMATKLHPGPMADRLNNSTKPALMNGTLTSGARGTTAWPVPAKDTGMISATAWAPESYEHYTFPYSQWTTEIRFPIRQTPGYSTRGGGYPTSHGGLIDADPLRQPEWDRYDPARGDAGPGRPRYWWVNFARAEHPRKYTMPDGSAVICPKNCTAALVHALNVTETCGGHDCKATWPTILGSYWEWVWGPVGDAHPGVGYMHRPSSFPMVQFANKSGEALCREWHSLNLPRMHLNVCHRMLYDTVCFNVAIRLAICVRLDMW